MVSIRYGAVEKPIFEVGEKTTEPDAIRGCLVVRVE